MGGIEELEGGQKRWEVVKEGRESEQDGPNGQESWQMSQVASDLIQLNDWCIFKEKILKRLRKSSAPRTIF